MAEVKAGLLYSKTHEWAEDKATAKVGLTDYNQEKLGEIVFVTLPEVGQEVTAGEKVCEIESLKAVTDISSPVSGKIVAVNSDLESAPSEINASPYETWIFEVEVTGKGDVLTADQYPEICTEE